MPRPGPLRELPLQQFLPPNPNLPSPRPNKRPLSPAGPILYSPAKRRILNQEGIFSPEKIYKSPISVRATPSRFTDTLSGPSSPARKLDFGTPKHPVNDSDVPTMSTLDNTPARLAPSSNGLAPSPELKSSWSGDEIDDYFSMPNRSHSSAAPPSVPREIPPIPDPQSIHFPGFRVHFDTQMILTVDNGLGLLSLMDNGKEGQKENIAPRRKPRKVATAPNTDLRSPLFSPDSRKRVMEKLNKAKSTPVTPKRLPGGNRQETGGSPTPRSFDAGPVQAVTSSTPRAIEGDRKVMRRALQDEVDDAGEDEYDEA